MFYKLQITLKYLHVDVLHLILSHPIKTTVRHHFKKKKKESVDK